MILEECVEMPTCNFAKTVHNKWLEQYVNKIICLYKATMDDLIGAFMHIAVGHG